MRVSIAPFLVVAFAGCDDGGPGRAGDIRTDSASVEIVTLGSSPWLDGAATARVSDQPLVVMGSEDTPLYGTIDATWSGSGVVVADGSSGRLLFFDETGALERSVGALGEGPGEFQRLSAVSSWRGDSIAAFDAGPRRLTFVGADGTLGRSLRIEADGRQGLRVEAVAGDRLVSVSSDPPSGEPGTERPATHVSLLDPDGSPISPIGPFPGRATFVGRGVGSVIMGPALATAVGAGRIVLGDGAIPAVREYDADGALIRLIRWPDHDRTLDPAWAEGLLERTLESVPEAQRAQARQMFAIIPVADSVPTLRDLVVATDGSIWVGAHPMIETLDPEAPAPPQEWFVLDETGAFDRRVTTSRGVRPIAVDGDRLLAIHLSPEGVQTVRVYRTP